MMTKYTTNKPKVGKVFTYVENTKWNFFLFSTSSDFYQFGFNFNSVLFFSQRYCFFHLTYIFFLWILKEMNLYRFFSIKLLFLCVFSVFFLHLNFFSHHLENAVEVQHHHFLSSKNIYFILNFCFNLDFNLVLRFFI